MAQITEYQLSELYRKGNKEVKERLEDLYPQYFPKNRPYEKLTPSFTLSTGTLKDCNGAPLNRIQLINMASPSMFPGEGLYIDFPLKKIQVVEHGINSSILRIKKDKQNIIYLNENLDLIDQLYNEEDNIEELKKGDDEEWPNWKD